MKMKAAALASGNAIASPPSWNAGRSYMRPHDQSPEEQRVLALFAERNGPVASPDRDALLRALGARGPGWVRKPIPINPEGFKPEDHIDPLLLDLYGDAEERRRYLDPWQVHASSCAYCTDLLAVYDILPPRED
ncbi:MAG: hypothetical protein M0000_02165 [Actinomycetota bacterium]|nr:hypothetical protein [Actinomycetota bacterium]